MTKVAPTNPFNDYVFINATPSDRGAFSLALEQALDKLEKFQLPEPSHFILQWIQALVAAEAQEILVTVEHKGVAFTTETSLTIKFDGPGYSARELDSLYDHVFLSGRDRKIDRLRELSLGWLSASSLKPSRLAIQSNGYFRLRQESGKRVDDRCGKATEDINVGGKSWNALEVTARGMQQIKELIELRCGDVPIKFTVNGQAPNSSQEGVGVPWPNRRFQNGPTRGVMGATYGGSASSQLAFLRYGVNFVSRPEPTLQPPIIARVDDPTLSKNVSQTDVVKDDAYEDFLARLRVEMKTMGIALTGKNIPSYQRDSLNKYIQSYIASHLDPRALDDPERLALMGVEYERLLKFPVFCSNRGIHRSLMELYTLYQERGCLLYCTSSQARALNWEGVLLVIEPGEATVVRKFCPNLIEVTLNDVRNFNRQGAQSPTFPIGARQTIVERQQLKVGNREYLLLLPDIYPTGLASLTLQGAPNTMPVREVPLTLSIAYQDFPHPDFDEVQHLKQALPAACRELLLKLCDRLQQQTQSEDFARLRHAELACELLNFELSQPEHVGLRPDQLHQVLPPLVNSAPLIGLEDGHLVSLEDLRTYMKLVPDTFLGGAFIQGLESGALDPMPEATKLLHRLFTSQQLTPTDRVRNRLADDSDLKMQFRRQTLIRGLTRHPNPAAQIAQFAKAAEAELAEIARLEKEYKEALEGKHLFVQPDEERLRSLSEVQDEPLLASFDLLGSEVDIAHSTEFSTTNHGQTVPLGPPPLPSQERDIEHCRELRTSFLTDFDALHIERRENSFALHLASLKPERSDGVVFLLCGDQAQALKHELPVEGFIRVCPTLNIKAERLLHDSLEQLIVRAVATFAEGQLESRKRRQLRDWLHCVGCQEPERLLQAEHRSQDLFDLATVPSLGGKFLTWRSLKEQYERTGQLLYWDSLKPGLPCPSREIVLLSGPLNKEVLHRLGFERLARWTSETEEQEIFEVLYRSSRRDLTSILSGTEALLLSPEITDRLAQDATLWRKLRTGFLSWDRERSVAILNPGHNLGKTLAKRFSQDPGWSLIFASALYSTINRGLEEVEDHHERVFLENLVECCD